MFTEIWKKHKKVTAVVVILLLVAVTFAFACFGRQKAGDTNEKTGRQEQIEKQTDSDKGEGLVAEDVMEDTQTDSVTAPKNWDTSEETTTSAGTKESGEDEDAQDSDDDILKDGKVWSRPR